MNFKLNNLLTYSLIALFAISFAACEKDMPTTPDGGNTPPTEISYNAGEVNTITSTNSSLLNNENKIVNEKYLLYVPDGYTADTEKALWITLHGMGNRGNNINSVRYLNLMGDAKSEDYDFLVMAPQILGDAGQLPMPSEMQFAVPQLKILIDEIISNFNIDENRIYISGLSMGGFITWSMVREYENFFAAAVPICGGDIDGGDNISELLTTPVWAFHSTDDTTVPFSVEHRVDENIGVSDWKVQGMKLLGTITTADIVYEIIQAGGGKLYRFTELQGKGHDSWTTAYSTPEMYEWVLSQSR